MMARAVIAECYKGGEENRSMRRRRRRMGICARRGDGVRSVTTMTTIFEAWSMEFWICVCRRGNGIEAMLVRSIGAW